MSYSVVISFEIPNDLVFSNLSNERYDKEKEFINPIMEQAGEKMHVPSLIMLGENGISLIHDNIKIGCIKLVEN